MTITNKNSETDLFALLEKSKFDFYLTGSRFFGTSRKNSDIDFFTELNTGIDEFLFSNDFRIQSVNNYTQTQIQVQDIYEIYYSPYHNCHIQIVINAERKNKIQNILKRSEIFETIETITEDVTVKKALAKQIWDLAYMLLDKE